MANQLKDMTDVDLNKLGWQLQRQQMMVGLQLQAVEQEAQRREQAAKIQGSVKTGITAQR